MLLINELVKIRKIIVKKIGKHGGKSNYTKLIHGTKRIEELTKIISKFNPEITISFHSPEAARVAFGLGIKHIGFSDSPHAEKVMKLTIPFLDKLLIPSILHKKNFVRYGISNKDIISYNAIDAGIIIRNRKPVEGKMIMSDKKNILVRLEEEKASYMRGNTKSVKWLDIISEKNHSENVFVLGRYKDQINLIRNHSKEKNIKIINKVLDNQKIWENVDIFIGSGGTMTAEAALLGIPTISYNAAPNLIQDSLVKKGLIKKITKPGLFVKEIQNILSMPESKLRKNRVKAKKILNSMQDPYPLLLKTIKSIVK